VRLQDVLAYHCYRGILTPNTDVYFSAMDEARPPATPQIERQDVLATKAEERNGGWQMDRPDCTGLRELHILEEEAATAAPVCLSETGAAGGLLLTHVEPRGRVAMRNIINVTTKDGEVPACPFVCSPRPPAVRRLCLPAYLPACPSAFWFRSDPFM
jgi:hypothetical protein